MSLYPKFGISCIFALFVLLTSCMETTTLGDELSAASDQIVLNLSAPQEMQTKADDGYKLRYSARIFRGTNLQTWTFIERKEIIEGEDNNQIVFKVAPNNNYTIMVFADYIPDSYTKSEDGTFNDYFYNTKVSNLGQKGITIRTTPGSNSENVSPDFFNNEKYDCFYGRSEVIEKTEAEYPVSITLKRYVARVSFQENSEEMGEVKVTAKKIGLRKTLNHSTGTTILSTSPSDSEANKSIGNIELTQSAEISEQQKELFFFYTLADNDTKNQYVSVEFQMTNGDNASEPISIKEIPVKANYKTVVKGAFLPAEKMDTPGDDENDNEGDIILTLSTNYDWEQETLYKE